MALLESLRIAKSFGGLVAVNELDFTLEKGMIAGLIGPNGAGKTTFFNMVTGLFRPSSGQLSFDGHQVTGLAPQRITALGIARTFQTIRLFANMNALDNVRVGMNCRLRSGWVGAILRPPYVAREERRARERALELLEYVGLGGRQEVLAKNLPYGHQRRLEIARALATRPELLLLDEALSGLRAADAQRLMGLIRSIRGEGTTIIMIEHIMKAIMTLSDRVVVLHHGEKIAEGAPEEVAQAPAVIQAYLGPHAPSAASE